MTSNSMTTTDPLAVEITESHAAPTDGLHRIVDARRLNELRAIWTVVHSGDRSDQLRPRLLIAVRTHSPSQPL
jgi:hypothetical protein